MGRRLGATLAGLALLAATGQSPARALVSTPGQPPPSGAQLGRLTAELDAATARARAAADALLLASARSASLRVAMDRALAAAETAQDQLDERARALYISGARDQLAVTVDRLTLADFGALDGLAIGERRQLREDADLVAAVRARSGAVAALSRQAEAVRAGLLGRAEQVYRIEDHARELLAAAQEAYGEAVRQRAATAADRALAGRLAAGRAALDALSGQVTVAVAPGISPRGRAAAAAQAPVLRLLEAAGGAIPTGYRLTGQVLTGTASWYGPGFVGNPTASGAPYDPEQQTCAMLAVPLGTVVHVGANGRATNCLVNDRGPYVGGRVLDMSRAGSRALGYDGLAQVTIAVLAPTR